MRTYADRLKHLSWSLLGAILILQFPGEPVPPASVQTTTVSVTLSNPACVQLHSGACSIHLGYLYASGSDTTFSRVEVSVDNKLRAYIGGFFESSAYLTYSMLPNGLMVTCGRPNASGSPNYGKAYSVGAKAYMADGNSASATATVFCPAYEGKLYLPLVRKN